jgi:hypothetical protein
MIQRIRLVQIFHRHKSWNISLVISVRNYVVWTVDRLRDTFLVKYSETLVNSHTKMDSLQTRCLVGSIKSGKLNSQYCHVYVLGLGYFVWPWSPHRHRTSPHISWRHTGAIDRYWYVYNVSLDEFQSFSKRYPSYALRKHMCGSAGCGGSETMNKSYPLWNMLL